jgi:hypothetical protein
MHGMNIKKLSKFFLFNVLWKRPDKIFGNKAGGFDAPLCQIVIPLQKETLNACELLKVQQHTGQYLPLGFALLDADR